MLEETPTIGTFLLTLANGPFSAALLDLYRPRLESATGSENGRDCWWQIPITVGKSRVAENSSFKTQPI